MVPTYQSSTQADIDFLIQKKNDLTQRNQQISHGDWVGLTEFPFASLHEKHGGSKQVSRELWTLALSLFGLHWVMLKWVVDSLAC